MVFPSTSPCPSQEPCKLHGLCGAAQKWLLRCPADHAAPWVGCRDSRGSPARAHVADAAQVGLAVQGMLWPQQALTLCAASWMLQASCAMLPLHAAVEEVSRQGWQALRWQGLS